MNQQQAIPLASAAKVLFKELKALKREPVEGFRIVRVDESDLYEWMVAIYGPPDTVYEGGCFKAVIRFGGDYPFQPPTFRFVTRIWHPNIYENGEVCISILHAPANQTTGGELPEERWSPAQNVRTIIMSIISLLNEPNTFSPANVDASIMYRDFKAQKSQRYREFVARCVADSKADAARCDIPLPENVNDYINIGRDDFTPGQASSSDASMRTAESAQQLTTQASNVSSSEELFYVLDDEEGSDCVYSSEPPSNNSSQLDFEQEQT